MKILMYKRSDTLVVITLIVGDGWTYRKFVTKKYYMELLYSDLIIYLFQVVIALVVALERLHTILSAYFCILY